MSHATRENVKAAFFRCLEASSDELRQGILQELETQTPEVASEVRQMLAAHDDASFLDQAANLEHGSAIFETENTDSSAADLFEQIGTQIGPYKIREQLGEGGMGVVYVAEQKKPVRRKVALKIIKPGMDTKQVIARFEAERQALAMMDHPNIAKVMDAGCTETGRPYFVMDLIRGIPITDYCDQIKMTTTERLELFISVCNAVQHAHQKGIIHRDLKPSNVMVTEIDGRAVPKVIDFGVAKATNQQLTEQTIYTQLSQMVGTPLYMSPEQAGLSGVDVDTRSDVYSLGVMLYELVSGNTPFDRDTLRNAGFDEMRRILQEVDPPRPSTRFSTLNAVDSSTISEQRGVDARRLQQIVHGELDWIVMRALDKDRNRRYDSASALALDVQRYLDDEAVEACPPSKAYRLQKYAKRHKGLLTTAALLVGTLLIATGVSISYAVQADEAKNEAVTAKEQSDENLDAALKAVGKLLEHASNPELSQIPQVQPIRKKILEDALEFYEKFIVANRDSPEIRYHAAHTKMDLAKLYQDMKQVNLALKYFKNAQMQLEELKAQFPNISKYRKTLAESYMRIGWINGQSLYEYKIASKMYEKAEEEYNYLAKHTTGKISYYQIQSIQAKVSIAENFKKQGDQDQYQKNIISAHEALRHLDHSLDNFTVEINVITALADIIESTDSPRAETLRMEAIEKSRLRYQNIGNREAGRKHILLLLNTVSFLYRQNNKDHHKEIVKLVREATGMSEELVSDFPSIVKYREYLSWAIQTRVTLVSPNTSTEEFNQILIKYQSLIPDHLDGIHAVYAKQLATETDSITVLSETIKQYPKQSVYYLARGELYVDQGKIDLALADLNNTVEVQANEGDAETYQSRANLFVKLKRYDKAIADYNKYVEIRNNSALSPYEHAKSYLERGEFYLDKIKNYKQALINFDIAIEKEPSQGHFYKRRGLAHFHLGNYKQALADIAKALELAAHDGSSLYWIPPELVAKCPDEAFREGMLKLADKAIENQDSAYMRIGRAGLHIAFGKWDKAREDLDAVITAEDAGYYPLYQAALLSLTDQDLPRYQELCQIMLTNFAESDEALATHFTAWTCALAPNALEDYTPAIKLARHAVEKEPNNKQYLDGLGAILMRAGQFDPAKVELDKALAAGESDSTSSSYIRYLLAMTEHHLGHNQAAQDQLQTANDAATKELEDAEKTPAWNRKLTLKLLRKEAEELIQVTSSQPEYER